MRRQWRPRRASCKGAPNNQGCSFKDIDCTITPFATIRRARRTCTHGAFTGRQFTRSRDVASDSSSSLGQTAAQLRPARSAVEDARITRACRLRMTGINTAPAAPFALPATVEPCVGRGNGIRGHLARLRRSPARCSRPGVYRFVVMTCQDAHHQGPCNLARIVGLGRITRLWAQGIPGLFLRGYAMLLCGGRAEGHCGRRESQ